MRTAMFTPCFLEGEDALGNNRLSRNVRYIDWYSKIQHDIGIDSMHFSDNNSHYSLIESLQQSANSLTNIPVFIHTNAKRLKGSQGWEFYPYCWRALYLGRALIESGKYDKLVFCDSDALVISRRLSLFVKDLSSGWIAFTERRYTFPTAEFHVLCRDEFDLFMEFTSVPYITYSGRIMERTLPFTEVITSSRFHAQRTGEYRLPQYPGQDLYCQAQLTIPLIYN